MPPIEKVYEAWTAIADGRVRLECDSGLCVGAAGSVTVSSSDGAKEYAVTWDGDAYSSTDNATYWQGYPGYPVLAVLMLQGRLPFDGDIARRFSGVQWKRINDEHKRDYAAALEEVFAESGMSTAERDACEACAEKTYDALEALDLTIKRKL